MVYRLKLFQHGSEIRELALEAGREYTFGRGANCDVQLEEESGISRSHFRLVEEGGQWTAQVVSKFGSIHHAGQPVQSLQLEPGAVFKLVSYEFRFLEAAAEPAQVSSTLPANIDRAAEDERAENADWQNQNQFQNVVGGVPMPISSGLPADAPEFSGNDEATRVAAVMLEKPFIRVLNPNGREEVITLDGRRWFAGREDGSDILLNDRKASRRQFELSSTPQGFFIRDLGSSNGTLLNGMALAADELKAIRSGDVIQVGRVVMHFEVRDPEFSKRLMVLPPDVRSDQPIMVQNPYEMINYPVVMGPGGAIRVDQSGGGNLLAKLDSIPIPFTEQLDDAKKKKVRFAVLAAAALLPILLVFMFTGPSQPPKAKAPVNAAFEKLSPNQQKQVRELFRLAKDLYIQNKLALADSYLKKLHELIPDGFENSLAMAADCDKQAEMERTIREMEEQRQRQQEIQRTVEKTIRDCEPISKKSYLVEEITKCLQPALHLDPDNSRMRELVNAVERRIEQRKMQEQERKDFRIRAAKGKALYQNAQSLELAGEYLDALQAYKKHADSSYPDPEGLKSISRKQISSISRKMGARVDDALRAAEAAYAVNKYKDAIDQIYRARKFDPYNQRAGELLAKFRREINIKMRELYEEAVINEGLGGVEEARAKWKKILETDHPDGEYYRKARSKLKNYGNL